MTIFHSIILGIVEGLTEFLPISSTAHLIITSKILNLPQTDFQKFFEVFIQSGAILAVVFLYFRYILKNKKLIKIILFSFIPTAIIGLGLYKIIKNVFFESNILLIAAMLFLGIVFLIIEFLIVRKKIVLRKSIGDLSLIGAVIIGLFQALAVVPGVSRAGIVMIAMILMSYKREESAKYSFLLAVPTILAAAGLDLVKTAQTVSLATDELVLIAVGFFMSMLTAYIVIKWFIGFLQKNSLVVFGVYRIVLGIILALIFLKPL